MTTNRKFNTIEDLVTYIAENHYRGKTRWTLQTNYEWVWVDEEAGKAWEAEVNKNPYRSWDDTPQYAEYERRRNELIDCRPEQKRITHYYLQESGDGYRLQYIELSNELGEQLTKVWTVRKTTYTENFTPTTIPGILKRLGHTEIGVQIKAAQKAADEASAKRNRNYARERARKLAAELLEVMKNHPDIIFPAQLTEIAAMRDEE